MPRRIAITFVTLLTTLTASAQQEIPLERDIVYGKADGTILHLDLATPPGDGPFPLVVCIHGGAWQIGHRAQHHPTIRQLARHGFVAATVQYRLAPKTRYPGQLDDCRAAIQFLRGRAKQYKIDPDRVGVLGDSAGGHLALLVGLGAESKHRVQAVVNYFGPTDLRTYKASDVGEAMFKLGLKGKDSNGLLADFLGTADRKAPVVATASPLSHVRKDNPPVLTFHGTADPLVPLEQASTLHTALKGAGAIEELVVLEKASHGWGGKMKDMTDRKTLEFLDRHLKAKR